MKLGKFHAELAVAALLLTVVALVYQQIQTSFADQGIASGGPYNNAAAYPETIAAAIAVLVLVTLGPRLWRPIVKPKGDQVSLGDIARPLMLLVLFAACLWALGTIGYLVSTPILMAAVMVLMGERRVVRLVAVSLLVPLVLSAVFGGMLDVVLPRGNFGLAIAW